MLRTVQSVLVRFTVVTMAALAVLIQSGCKTEAQKPKEIFSQNTMPATLFRAANQLHEIRDYDAIVARVEADRKNPSLVRVAVIDNGIDLAHPDLEQKIAFDVEKGQIVGAGLDIMGGDRFPSHNLINGSLYAFGAKSIENGLITGASQSPLRLIGDFNDAFMARLTAKIKADPILAKSLFAKITADNFSLYGAHYVTANKSYRFNKDAYARAKAAGTLITPNQKSADTKTAKGEDVSELQRVSIFYMVESPWEMSGDDNMPRGGGDDRIYFTQIEGADVFLPMLTAELNAFKQDSGYGAAFETYKSYLKTKEFDPTQSEDDTIENTTNKLAQAYYFKRFGPTTKDPLRKLTATVKDLTIRTKIARGEKIDSSYKITYADVKSTYDLALMRIQKMIDVVSTVTQKTADEERKFSGLKENYGVFKEFAQWILTERVWERSSLATITNKLPQNSIYRSYFTRTGHPYFSEASAESLHGSHVSGIISLQNPDVRIVPVRVTTESTQAPPLALRAEKDAFKARFIAWLEEPVVFRAVGSKLSSLIPEIDFKNASVQNRASAARLIASKLNYKIETAFDADWTNFTFVEEVKQAIRYVGQQKIKLANVSLGMNFGKVVATSVDTTAQKRLERIFTFLQFEFFKYDIARELQTSAPNTLFVIAAGNEGNWVDGRSRTALPVDLSSPFLEAFEDASKGELAPNNHITNILGVGSIGPDKELSSYTNILLSAKTPFILAEGENILSPVRSTSQEPINALMKANLPETDYLSSLESMAIMNDPRLADLFDKDLTPEQKADPEKADLARQLVGLNYRSSVSVLRNALEASRMHLFLKYPSSRARLSGTSMATPTVVGLVSKLVSDKAAKLGLNARDIYDNPAFSPAALVEDAFKATTPLSANMRGISLQMLLGDKKWDATPNSQAVEKIIADLIAKGRGVTPAPLAPPIAIPVPVQRLAR